MFIDWFSNTQVSLRSNLWLFFSYLSIHYLEANVCVFWKKKGNWKESKLVALLGIQSDFQCLADFKDVVWTTIIFFLFSSSFSAAYIKVYLLENGICIAKKKTKSVRKSLDPLYNQVLVFSESPQGKVVQVN